MKTFSSKLLLLLEKYGIYKNFTNYFCLLYQKSGLVVSDSLSRLMFAMSKILNHLSVAIEIIGLNYLNIYKTSNL